MEQVVTSLLIERKNVASRLRDHELIVADLRQTLGNIDATLFHLGYYPEARMATRKDDPINTEYETRAKNLLKGELKRRGITYAQLADIGIQENERNLNNKISRGGFSAAFLLQCLGVIGCEKLTISDL